jgi:hypothetical protein
MKIRKPMRVFLLGGLCLAAGAALAGTTMYKWVDAQGVVHYSDQPHPGAKKLTLPAAATYTPAPAPPLTASAPAEPAAQKPYQEFAITEPQPKQTFQNTGGQAPVTVTVSPGLRKGDQISYRVDGRETESSPTRALSITLHGMNRGTHTVQAEILSADGTAKANTDKVTFYVKQHSIRNPHPRSPLTNNNFSFKHHAPPH